MPKIALDDVCTTLATFASRAASSTLAVPTAFTDQKRSRSFASGTWATLCRIASTPSHAARSASRSRMSPITWSVDRSSGGLRSKIRTSCPSARPRSGRPDPK